MVLVRDIVQAIDMSKKGFRNNAKTADAKLLLEDSSDTRRCLMLAGALDGWEQNAKIYVMRLSHIQKMMPERAEHVRIMGLLEDAGKSKPPPMPGPNLPSMGGEEEDVGMEDAPAPWKSMGGLRQLAAVADAVQEGIRRQAAPGIPDISRGEDNFQDEPVRAVPIVPRLVKARVMGRSVMS